MSSTNDPNEALRTITETWISLFHRLGRADKLSNHAKTAVRRALSRTDPVRTLELSLVYPTTRSLESDIKYCEQANLVVPMDYRESKVPDVELFPSPVKARLFKNHVKEEVQAILQLLVICSQLPDPSVFDGVLLHNYDKPVLFLKTDPREEADSGICLFMEINRVRKVINQQIDRASEELFAQQLRDANERADRVLTTELSMLGLLGFGVATIGLIALMSSDTLLIKK